MAPSCATPVDSPHIPVMLREVLAALDPRADETYIDGTLGAGGYSRAILDHADCRVIAIDRDAEAHRRAAAWQGQYGNRLILVQNTFGNVRDCVSAPVNGFVLDIGVSSMQIDQAERGFSFRFDGPLDMRMDQGSCESAADLVNTMSESDLADLIYAYGDERHSRRIAKAIVEARKIQPVTTTGKLASIIRTVIPKTKKDDIDPATRSFQALRIAVNDELGELQRALDGAEHVLAEGGRLAIVTFHSLEDRIVKNFLKERSGDVPSPSRHLPAAAESAFAPTFKLLSRKAVEAADDETQANPRARSARLRAAVRTAAPPWPDRKAERGAA
jgi:16S rRNA (cytosine1402-N4)-methyltransferase